MLTELEQELIRANFFNNHWYNPDTRPKTMKAVFRVMENISPEERDIIMQRISLVFAPPPSFLGLAEQARVFANQIKGQYVVYLAPALELRSQKCVNAAVAHEFAHVLLEHPTRNSTSSVEEQAWDKAHSWGFSQAHKTNEHPDSSKKRTK